MSEVSSQGAAPASTAAPASSSEAPSTQSNVDVSQVSGEGNVDISKAAEQAANQVAQEINEVSDPSDEVIEAELDAEDAKAVEEAAKSAIKKFQIKVDGEEMEEEIDLSDEELVKRHLQKSKAFDRRSKEYSSLQKDVDTFFKAIQASPQDAAQVLSELGMDVNQFAEQVINSRLEELSLSDEEKEKRNAQKELEDYKKKVQEYEERLKAEEQSKADSEAAKQLDSEISDAMEKHSKLPKTQYIVKRIADTGIAIFKKTGKHLPMNEVVKIVDQQIRTELDETYDAMDDDTLSEVLNKHAERIRKKRIATRKASQKAVTANKTVETGKKKNNPEEPKKKLTYSEFFGNLGHK